jgi:hypothetical protein
MMGHWPSGKKRVADADISDQLLGKKKRQSDKLLCCGIQIARSCLQVGSKDGSLCGGSRQMENSRSAAFSLSGCLTLSLDVCIAYPTRYPGGRKL